MHLFGPSDSVRDSLLTSLQIDRKNFRITKLESIGAYLEVAHFVILSVQRKLWLFNRRGESSAQAGSFFVGCCVQLPQILSEGEKYVLKEQHCQQRSSFNLGKISLASLQFLLFDSGLEHPFRLHPFGVIGEELLYGLLFAGIDASMTL